MKLFLRPTAFFACIALMFCACSEEETASKVLTPADSSEVTSITAGNGKIVVDWAVPADDENIVYCVITWSSDNGEEGEYALYAAADDTDADTDTDEEDSTTISKSYTISNIPAGEYLVSVQNYGDIELDSPAVSESVTVYDYTTYISKQPTVSSMFIESSEVVMLWDNIDVDCLGVVVTYTNTSGEEAKTTLTKITEGQPLVVTNAKSGSAFTYTSVFYPEGGLDVVYLTDQSEAAGTFPVLRATVPATPTEVVVNPGDYKMKVSWTLQDDLGERIAVVYTDATGSHYEFINSLQGSGIADSAELLDIPVAQDADGAESKYDVAVKVVSADGNVSESVNIEGVGVYDYIEYRLECASPAITTYEYVNNSYDIEFVWDVSDECKEMIIEYINKDDYAKGLTTTTTVTYTTMTDNIVYDNIVPGSEYKCTATFVPSDYALDTLVRTMPGSFPAAEVWKTEKGDYDFADYTYVWKEYKMSGDATVETGYSVGAIFDGEYDDATQYLTKSNATAPYQTVTIDLGRTYKLSKFAYKPYGSNNNTRLSGANLKILNLYGTREADPSSNSDYNQYSVSVYTNTASTAAYFIPDLSNWQALYEGAEMSTSLTANSNGAYEFNISDDCDPVRYIKIQFVESFETDRTNDYRINELDFWHNGVFDEDNGWSGQYRAYNKW